MNNILALAPLAIVLLAALLVLLLEAFLRRENKNYLGYFSLFFIILSGVICLRFWNANYTYFQGMLLLDNLSLFLHFLLAIGMALVILISLKYLSLQDANFGEYYALLLMAFSGMMIMVASTSLLVIFLGLEVLSISSYGLAGLRKKDEKSSESAIKYFLLGSFSSAFLILGFAFLFGATKSLDIARIIDSLRQNSDMSLMALIGLGLLIIGFGFKVSLVPFHMWTPDVYEGAPTPITAFFSVGPKVVGFVVLLRIFNPFWKSISQTREVFWVLWVLAVLTMIFGNLIALRQTNLKRLLAYSSIAHAGYLLIAILANDSSSLVFYLTVYLFMNIGAFASLLALNRKGTEYLDLEDFAGIGYKFPWVGGIFSVFLISLAGFPPTGGFLAKFFVFVAAVRENMTSLVIIAVLASLISVFYYLRIIIYMYMREPSRTIEVELENPAVYLVLFICLYAVLQLGIFPGNILFVIRQAVSSLSLF